MSREVKKKGSKQDVPDVLCDAIDAVQAYDKARLAKAENKTELHARAVKKIQFANNLRGEGFISISKARAILQSAALTEKEKILNMQKDKSAA